VSIVHEPPLSGPPEFTMVKLTVLLTLHEIPTPMAGGFGVRLAVNVSDGVKVNDGVNVRVGVGVIVLVGVGVFVSVGVRVTLGV
jgi:hypothetical protein